MCLQPVLRRACDTILPLGSGRRGWVLIGIRHFFRAVKSGRGYVTSDFPSDEEAF